MKVINLKKVAYLIITIIFVLTQITFVYAATTSELKQQQSDIQDKIDEAKTELSGVQSQKSSTLKQIESMIYEASQYESEIEELEETLKTLNNSISEKEKEISERQEKFDENQELLNKRLVALYKTSNTTYLDVLLSAEDLTDLISKYYLIAQLAEYDTKLLNQIEEEKNTLEEEKLKLDIQKKDVEQTKNNIKAKSTSLSILVKEKNTLVSTLSTEEKQLQQKVEEFEKDKREIASELAKLASNTPIKQNVTPSTAGYISPLAGKTKRNITTGYHGYKGHTGVDWAISKGTPILAVKSGTVAISRPLKNSDGSYRSYGDYIVINHHDGTMTLYAHGLPGSRLVSEGQGVSQGQQIMSVGTTGNSTGYHLHFEVRVNGKCVDPTPYLP